MVLRKKGERLWVMCKKCGKMYPPTTVKPGLCPKCHPNKHKSWLDKLAKESLKHRKIIKKKNTTDL